MNAERIPTGPPTLVFLLSGEVRCSVCGWPADPDQEFHDSAMIVMPGSDDVGCCMAIWTHVIGVGPAAAKAARRSRPDLAYLDGAEQQGCRLRRVVAIADELTACATGATMYASAFGRIRNVCQHRTGLSNAERIGEINVIFDAFDLVRVSRAVRHE